ncbi:MAG TPA: glycosyltransferase family 4 protein [Anaerolineaceae bacterium]|nr:glycosyltransferase family 4 protein [Anaerolineaceae bacterium]
MGKRDRLGGIRAGAPVKLGLIIYGSLDTLSGGYLYDRKLVEYLRRQGDTVEVIALPWRAYGAHLADNLSLGLWKRIRGLPIDVLLEDELNHPSLFWLNSRLKRAGSPLVVSVVHHLRISEQHPRLACRLYRWVEKLYLCSVDGFIYNSQTTCREVEALRGGPARAVIATPAGDRFGAGMSEAEILVRTGEKIRSGRMGRLVFLGNLIERKGLHTLIAALARPEAAGWELRVIGRSDLEPRYAARVRELAARLGERVAFRGRLDEAALSAELRQADVLAVPSSYEGFGIAYLEGMAFGLPALACSTGGAGEIVIDGESGFLVPVGDDRILADALKQLADGERLQAMSLKARRRYNDFPTWDESAGRIRDFLLTWR